MTTLIHVWFLLSILITMLLASRLPDINPCNVFLGVHIGEILSEKDGFKNEAQAMYVLLWQQFMANMSECGH
jgi:hypothetical protein